MRECAGVCVCVRVFEFAKEEAGDKGECEHLWVRREVCADESYQRERERE